MALVAACLLTNTAWPAAGSVAVGQTVVLSVFVDGTAPFTFQWFKDGVSLPGVTARTYVIISARTADAGRYHVEVANSAGSVASDEAAVTVTPAADASALTFELGNESVAEGDSVTFAVDPSGSGYRWQRQPAGSTAWEDVSDGDSYRGAATATLTVDRATAAMSGDQFRCVTTSPAGSTTSKAVTLTVGTAPFQLQFPAGIARDSAGNLYVADASSNTIQKVTPAGVVTTLAGAVGTVGSADGTGTGARFNQPTGVAVDPAGNVYVADAGNATIRKISPGGVVSTLAGSAAGRGSRDGNGGDALFSQPDGVAVDQAGTVYVTDAVSSVVRKVTSDRAVTTLVGTAGSRGEANGNGPAARLNFPTGVAVDAAGNLYVADAYNATIRKIAPDGTVITLAGSAGITGAVDLTGPNALFNQPLGVAVDADGNVYVADTGNSTIRRIAPNGAVSTLAGTAGIAGLADGTGPAALFNRPHDLVVDGAGNLFVADSANAAIRRVTANGAVTTLVLTPPVSASPPPAASTPQVASGSGGPAPASGNGGGGAIGGWFVAALLLLAAARCSLSRRRLSGR